MALCPHKEQLNNNRSLLKTLLILFISYTTVGLCNNGFFSILPFISEEFSLTRVQIGYYSAFYFASAALLAIISGNIVDKFGPKKSILWGMGCMGITLFCYGLSASYQTILFLAIFAGLGMSILTPSVIKGASMVAPFGKQAFYSGMVQSGYSVGSIIGPAILPILALNFGWRISIQFTATATLLIGFLIYFIYQEQKVKKHNNIKTLDSISVLENQNQSGNELSFKDSLLDVITDKSLLLICMLGIVFGVAEGSVFSHFTVFLTGDLGFNKVITGLGFATLYIGGVTGMAGLGWISDSFFKKNRKIFLFLISLFTGIMFLIFSLLSGRPQISASLIMTGAFILGVVAVGWPGAYFVMVGKLAGGRHAGIATGLALFFVRTGILLAPMGFGYIADLNGNYQYSWLSFGLLIVLISPIFLYRK